VRGGIINKTPLSCRTNRSIGSRRPSEYLRAMEKKDEFDAERMDAIGKPLPRDGSDPDVGELVDEQGLIEQLEGEAEAPEVAAA
jgi:hypothetical protein